MFDQAKLDSCTAAKEFRACLFGLCFFHSLVLGRRRFGQLGWSRSYGFTAGDLSICANILQSYWEASVSAVGGSASGSAPWQELRYIFGEIMYGGHITDYFDRRVTMAYLEVSCCHVQEPRPHRVTMIELPYNAPILMCAPLAKFLSQR